MNEKVRTYLIEAAKCKDKFVFYSEIVKACNLNIDISTEYGRKQLSEILWEVSNFENSQPVARPLLSALAIYKDQSKNDHGDGFYRIAEKLGKGNFKVLKDNLYGFTEAEKCRLFWQNENNYKAYASLTIMNQKTISDLFISLIENERYSWANEWKNTYLDFVKEIKILKQAIVQNPEKSIDDVTLFLDLSKSINTYHNFMRKWLKEKSNGISSRGQSVLSDEHFDIILANNTFKIIAKAIILDPNIENYNSLFNWWYSNSSIYNRPLLINRALAACYPEILSSTVHSSKFWDVVNIVNTSFGFDFEYDHNNNWYSANIQLTKWLDTQLKDVLDKKTSDKLEQQIWRNIFVWLIYEEFNSNTITPNTLIKKGKPKNGFDTILEKERKFEGVDIDFQTKAKDLKDLGDAGEKLVKQYEIKYLIEKGLKQKSLDVKIVKDGKGFDILSFDELGNEKFIEVKTTTGGELNPFYLSENEVAFMRKNINSYCIYRIYNYDEENNSGEFFEIKGNVENQILMKPTQYQVVIKNEH
jgi:hypothetical protein